jgi:SAM-dependent methyltransferase
MNLGMTVRRVLRGLNRRLLPVSLRAPVHARLQRLGLLGSLYQPELDIIRREVAAHHRDPWREFESPTRTFDMRERVVEVPWVLSRYGGEHTVLDIGTANALGVYVDGLLQLRVPELIGLDLSNDGDGRVDIVTGDVRRIPFEDERFDLVICVSTLEHVGANNRRYGWSDSAAKEGDRDQALAEIRRVLRPGGRMLLTMPFGRHEEQDWFTQYDWPGWQALIRRSGLEAHEVATYAHSTAGWTIEDPGSLAGIAYGEAGAPAAGAVICADLRRPA